MGNQQQQIIAEIQADILLMEQDDTLCDEANYDARANAIDFIDFHILEHIASLQSQTGQNAKLDALKTRAYALNNKLETIDDELFKNLKKQIRAGESRGEAFRKMIAKYCGNYLSGEGQTDDVGYSNLDGFNNGLLLNKVLPSPVIELQTNMVFYQQTPAQIIFELASKLKRKPGDVFYDLGSGLGQVSVLINLLTGIAARGVEYEPAYCQYAQACALSLNLAGVEFINADAREVDYSKGSMFFMYTPFKGEIMQQVLKTLQMEAAKHTVKIFTYGPCSAVIAAESWLACVNKPVDSHYKLYEFESL